MRLIGQKKKSPKNVTKEDMILLLFRATLLRFSYDNL